MRERVSGGLHVVQICGRSQRIEKTDYSNICLPSRKRFRSHLQLGIRECCIKPIIIPEGEKEGYKSEGKTYPILYPCVASMIHLKQCTTQGEHLHLMLPRVRSSRLPIVDIPSPGQGNRMINVCKCLHRFHDCPHFQHSSRRSPGTYLESQILVNRQ